MKTKSHLIALCALLATALSVPGLSAADRGDNEPVPSFYPVSAVTSATHQQITAGDHQSAVERIFGKPSVKLRRDLWVYRNQFRPKLAQARANECYNLVVALTDHRVSQLYFANCGACDVVCGRIENGVTELVDVLKTVPAGPIAEDMILITYAGR